jgi:hypothetical protein
MIRKGELPTKICATCGKPFAWRKKWARDWDNLRHCSERCRRNKLMVKNQNLPTTLRKTP